MTQTLASLVLRPWQSGLTLSWHTHCVLIHELSLRKMKDLVTCAAMREIMLPLERDGIYIFSLSMPCVVCLAHSGSNKAPRELASASVKGLSSLVDPASSHMLVSKIKPCMSKSKLCLHGETADGSLNQSWSKRASPCYLDNCGNSRANTCNSYPAAAMLTGAFIRPNRWESSSLGSLPSVWWLWITFDDKRT